MKRKTVQLAGEISLWGAGGDLLPSQLVYINSVCGKQLLNAFHFLMCLHGQGTNLNKQERDGMEGKDPWRREGLLSPICLISG